MKKTFAFLCLFLFFSLSVFGQSQPDKVAKVAAGQLKEARASWWGFDANDSTKSLQAAIHSKVPKLIVDTMPTPWITEPLQLVSDQEIVFEKGCVVQAKRGAFKDKYDSLFNIILQKNVSLIGQEGATLRMWIADYHTDAYEKAEWRHGINVKSSENVTIQGLTIADSGGDGIYLGVAQRGVPCKNVRIHNVVCDNNNRQGISVISAENLLIEDTVMKNTAGTAPRAGIDFEPNHPSEVLINCVMKNCVTENNVGGGYILHLLNFNRSTTPISLRFENCVSKNDKGSGFNFNFSNGSGAAVGGSIDVVNCRFERSGQSGLSIRGKQVDGNSLSFENVVVDECGEKPEVLPIAISSRNADQLPLGNIQFRSVRVIDSKDRPFFGYKDFTRLNLPLEAVTGEIVLERNGQTTTHRIDDAWIDKNFPRRIFKQIPAVDPTNLKLVPLQAATTDVDRTVTPLRSRNGGEFWFYAEKGSPLRFTVRQGQVSARFPGKEESVKFVAPSGKRVALPKLKLNEDTDYLVKAAPETGVYRFQADVGRNWVALKKTNCPVVLAAIPREAHLFTTRGEFYFYVPEGTKEFGLRFCGEGSERVKATVFDPSGAQVWMQDNIEEMTAFDATISGVWKIKLDRPAIGTFEDFFVTILGIPPLLGFAPELLLK